MPVSYTTRRLALLGSALIVLVVVCSACVKVTIFERLPLEDSSKATATAPSTPTPAEGACGQLTLLGTTVEADSMAMMVNAVVRPATEMVAAGNPVNPAPQPGYGFVLVSLSITCEREEGEVCGLDPAANWGLVDASGALARPQAGVSGVPGIMTRVDVPGGSTVYRGLVFEVAQASTGLLLQYEQPAGSPQACLQVSADATLPAWVPTPTAVPIAVSPLQTPAPPTATPVVSPTVIEMTVVFSPLATPPPTATPVTASPLATPTLPPTATPIVFLPPSGQTACWMVALPAIGAALIAAAGGLWLLRRARNRQ